VASQSGPPFDLDLYPAALSAAAQRIVPNRKKMSLEDAEDIVRMEFERLGLPLSRAAEEFHAKWFHRSPWWSLLHPLQADRDGARRGWPWSTKANAPVPVAVEALAYDEALRLTGPAAGPLPAGLAPAECQRVSRTEYFCVAQVLDSNLHPTHAVEVRIFCRRGGTPRVMDSVLKQL
jgi:hypothetical protein